MTSRDPPWAPRASVYLLSRRIVRVSARVSVEPAAVGVATRNCRRGGSGAVCLRARLCFRAESRGREPLDTELDLRYNVSLEERTPGSRAAFDAGGRRLLRHRRIALAPGNRSCVRVPFHVLVSPSLPHGPRLTGTSALPTPGGEADGIPPQFRRTPRITCDRSPLDLTWALDAAAGPVLDQASPSALRKLIPFFKDCGDDGECVADLVLRAAADIAGSRQSPHVLRKGRRRMLVEVELENREEDAYNASLCCSCPGTCTSPASCSSPPPTPLSPPCQVSFTLELEFSCSILLDRAEVTLQATR
ncbi:hypothetical protein DUI87_00241 [Hirundo rustica rustica]|uniref:Integrin alpha-2 domain-containing protein n=1 Tax=Hirundo rustica rustica TaxID=333673 RepID=A0A3M0LB85_HIRRU|nr:hypothetical protein DUI87_00241 [Hirundo rustica rustica]